MIAADGTVVAIGARSRDQPVFETATGVTRRLTQTDRTRGMGVAVNEYEPGMASAPIAVHPGIEYRPPHR